jgi:hypothetical protein
LRARQCGRAERFVCVSHGATLSAGERAMGDMGGFNLEDLFLFISAIQPILNIVTGIFSQGLQFLFLFLDFGTFFLGFI